MVPLAELEQLLTKVVVKEGALAAVTVEVVVTLAPQISVSFIV